jgi:hypothetical protein
MRKFMTMITPVLLVAGISGYCYFTSGSGKQGAPHRDVVTARHPIRDDGDAETSDAIEPLVVDRGQRTVMIRPVPAADEVPTRVVLAPGMTQPPRPDADAVLRMPYADEDFHVAPPNPAAALVETALSRLKLFDNLAEPEESGPEVQDFHRVHPHCPYPFIRR